MTRIVTWEPHRCGARRVDGGTCMRWALRGGKRCKIHGSGSAIAKNAADHRMAEGKVARDAASYGLPITIDPSDAFIQELARTEGHVEWLSERIQETPQGDLIWGVIKKISRYGVEDENSWDEEEVGTLAHIWLALYFRERQHLIKIADAMIKNGLTEMQLRLNARMVEVFEGAMLGMLTDLRIDPTDPAVRVVISERMSEAANLAAQPLAIEKSK